MKTTAKKKAEPPPLKIDAQGFIKCRVCGCTEIQPCEPPCDWADGDLCTGCDEAARALVDWLLGAHRPSKAALWREVEAQLGEERPNVVLTELGKKFAAEGKCV